MRCLIVIAVVAACGAEELDLFGDGGRPKSQAHELRLEGGISYRWWQMTVDAEDTGGSLAEGEYRYRDATFAQAGLRLTSRPWRFDLDLAASLGGEDPSLLGSASGIFVGDDAFWWDLAPRFTLAFERRRAELETALGTRDVRVDQERFELGLTGQGGDLAGSDFEIYLARMAYPAVVGFRSDDPAVSYATIDEDFETWRLGVGFAFDWAERAFATRRRYVGPYAGIWGEMAYLWEDLGANAAAEARAATGSDRIISGEYWDFAGGVDVGFQWHRRSAELGEAGFVLQIGWRLSLQVLGIDDSYTSDPAADTLVLGWDQYTVEHGPRASLAIVF